MFEGTAIRLVPMTPNMADHVVTWLRDPEVAQWAIFGDPYPPTREGIARAIEGAEKNPNGRLAAIELIAEPRIVGEVMLQSIDWKNRSAEVAIIVGSREHRGKGLGTQALRCLCTYAFGGLNLNRLEAHILAENQRALRCFQRVGFHIEGKRRQAVLKGDQRLDVVLVALLGEDFFGASRSSPFPIIGPT